MENLEKKTYKKSWVWWVTPVIPALRRLLAEGPQVQGQPELHSETLSQKNKLCF
jgi:hypothetical protein